MNILRNKIRTNVRNSFKKLFSKRKSLDTSDSKPALSEIRQNNQVPASLNRGEPEDASSQQELPVLKKNLIEVREKKVLETVQEQPEPTEKLKPKSSNLEAVDREIELKKTHRSHKGSVDSGSWSKINICPTGKHKLQKPDDACICIHTNHLIYHQAQPVVKVWHKGEVERIGLSRYFPVEPSKCIQGGQGVVFKVRSTDNSYKTFALKMKLRENKGNSAWMIERREANVLRKVHHDFIVDLYHVYETPQAMFMSMEFLDGGCLWSHIAQLGTFPESYTVYYAACILSALTHLHKFNIVYRDMKAENIVLDRAGRPHLIDFGMAKYTAARTIDKNNGDEDEPYPTTQYYFAAYLAPEIYTKSSSSNLLIDSWGLGYIVSEILLGYGVFVSMPWEKPDQHSDASWDMKIDDNISVSELCRSFMRKMLKHNPQDRMTLTEASHHGFFDKIRWSSITAMQTPDLTVFRNRQRGVGQIKAVLHEKRKLPERYQESTSETQSASRNQSNVFTKSNISISSSSSDSTDTENNVEVHKNVSIGNNAYTEIFKTEIIYPTKSRI